MVASNTTETMMGVAVISQGLFFPSLVSPIPTSHKSSYKVMGHLTERVPTPPTPHPLKTIRMVMNTTKAMGGGNGVVASIIDRGEDDPPSPLSLRWRALSCMSSR